MSNPPVPSFAQARDRTIEQLSAHFAQDDLTLEELERRIERAYKAESVVDLEALTADLRQRATMPPAQPSPLSVQRNRRVPIAPADYDRVVSIMGETRRSALWVVPQYLDVVSIMSDTRLDLSTTGMPNGVVDIHVRAVWSALKIVLPCGVRVVNRMSAFMASVQNDVADVPAPMTGAVVRLTGLALMAEVKVLVSA